MIHDNEHTRIYFLTKIHFIKSWSFERPNYEITIISVILVGTWNWFNPVTFLWKCLFKARKVCGHVCYGYQFILFLFYFLLDFGTVRYFVFFILLNNTIHVYHEFNKWFDWMGLQCMFRILTYIIVARYGGTKGVPEIFL